MKTKLPFKQSVFDFSITTWIVYCMLFVISEVGVKFSTFAQLQKLIAFMICIGLSIVVFKSRYTRAELLKMLLILLSGLVIAFFTKSESAIMFLLACCASKDIDIDKTLETIFKFAMITFLTVIVLAFSGIIQNKTSEGLIIWDRRMYLGFRHPNMCGAVLLYLILLKIISAKAQFKVRDYIFTLALEIVNYIGPKSKTSLILGMVAIAAVFIYNNLNQGTIQVVLRYMRYAPFILLGISILVVYGFNANYPWVVALNTLFSTRIEQMSYFWNKYPLTAFGQILENVSSSQSNTIMQMRGLDNGYLYILLGEGVVFATEYMYLFVCSIKKSWMGKRWDKLIVLCIILLQGLMETAVFRIEMQPCILLLANGLYCESHQKKIESV